MVTIHADGNEPHRGTGTPIGGCPSLGDERAPPQLPLKLSEHFIQFCRGQLIEKGKKKKKKSLAEPIFCSLRKLQVDIALPPTDKD